MSAINRNPQLLCDFCGTTLLLECKKPFPIQGGAKSYAEEAAEFGWLFIVSEHGGRHLCDSCKAQTISALALESTAAVFR